MNPALRRRVLSEWRGWTEPEDPGRNLRTVAEAMRPWLDQLSGSDWLGEERIRGTWNQVVGPFLATHAQPIALKRGTLHIRVVQPAVRHALEQGMKKELLAKLQDAFGRQIVHTLVFTTI
jgi:predicted nucleic acid-binding Zn ribbon protein